ncbi:MAG TPA: (Fe-S)-binding protein [Myxococcota bacterium]|nr:(Fe-S)-binding protein [Myxococcota bacterium]
MAPEKKKPSLRSEIDRCVRCGACMAQCPVYGATQREGGVARGKIALTRAGQDGRLAAGQVFRFHLSACLLCGSCTAVCPNQVDTPFIVQAERARLAAAKKTGRLKSYVLRKILPSRRLLPALLSGARFSRLLWASKVPKESGLHIRFLRGPGGERHRIPKISRPFFIERGKKKAVGTEEVDVALFAGCVSNYLRPQAAGAALAGLAGLGASVIVPADQGCCGLPAFGAGETQAARKLALRNLDAFLPADGHWPRYITSPCASCVYMLSKHMVELLSDDVEVAGRAREFEERVVPFSALWLKLRGDSPPKTALGEKRGPLLTYHDPCHLAKGLKERDAPRKLLTSLPNARFTEMEDADRCCGQGGSFCVSHYDLSLAIAERKLDSVLRSGADILVTECSGCLLQLTEALGRVKPGSEVILTSEALLRFGEADPETD